MSAQSTETGSIVSPQSVEKRRKDFENGALGAQYGEKGKDYGKLGGRPRAETELVPKAVKKAVDGVVKIESSSGHKQAFVKFVQKQLQEQGLAEKDVDEAWMSLLRESFFSKGTRTRQMIRIWERRTKNDEQVQSLNIGKSGDIYADKRR